MRKKPPRPRNPDPVKAAFIEVQKKWYSTLAREGFSDIEDVTHPDRPLLKWSGVSHNNHVESERALLSSWPDSPFIPLEDLLYHPDLPSVCESICKHGNHSLTPALVRRILEMNTQGMTFRLIGKALGINYVTVFRAQKKLNEWAILIESRHE